MRLWIITPHLLPERCASVCGDTCVSSRHDANDKYPQVRLLKVDGKCRMRLRYYGRIEFPVAFAPQKHPPFAMLTKPFAIKLEIAAMRCDERSINVHQCKRQRW